VPVELGGLHRAHGDGGALTGDRIALAVLPPSTAIADSD
jgi:hypothetical protein